MHRQFWLSDAVLQTMPYYYEVLPSLLLLFTVLGVWCLITPEESPVHWQKQKRSALQLRHALPLVAALGAASYKKEVKAHTQKLQLEGLPGSAG